jgi:hypothetical protein
VKHPILYLITTLLMLTLVFTACAQPASTVSSVLGYMPVGQIQKQQADERIQNAMSAGPMAIAKDATILDFPTEAGGDMVVLREGTNGWVCIADWPDSPGNDPQCLDQTWQQWNDAYAAGADPNVTAPGVAYMLQGGSDPSNTDPLATAPAEGEDWVSTPPHVMILSPEPLDTNQFTTDHHSGEPYVMWAGTPYEHIMMPIEVEAVPETNDRIQSAMSAAPMAIAKDATIMDYPTEPGGDFVELRQGTNGWTCYADWPDSPGNDPQCLDQTWMQWNDAYFAGAEPNITTPGVAYMLQGGSDPSNTDPLATAPAEGEDWVSTPPHVMILSPEPLDTNLFTTDHTSGEPYVMWAGTPYEHIMMPIQAGEMASMSGMSHETTTAAPAPVQAAPTTLPQSGEVRQGLGIVALVLVTGAALVGAGWFLLRRREVR